jgi:glutathione peroxidase
MFKTSALLSFTLVLGICFFAVRGDETKKGDKPVPGALNFTMKSLDGNDVKLDQYQGKVILMVNTASKCGFTPQYKDLEALYKKYEDKGFVILGFPANNFAHQEPGTDKQIAEFCTANYGVTFPMFSKIDVLGPDKAPLYQFLTESSTDPQFPGEVKWNFEKFLISRDGQIVGRFLSPVKPSSDAIVSAVEKELAK